MICESNKILPNSNNIKVSNSSETAWFVIKINKDIYVYRKLLKLFRPLGNIFYLYFSSNVKLGT